MDALNKLKEKGYPQFGDSQVSANESSDYEVNEILDELKEQICPGMRQ